MYIIMKVTAEWALKAINSTNDQALQRQYAPYLQWYNSGNIKTTFKNNIEYSIIRNT